MTSDFRKPAKIKSSNGDQHRNHVQLMMKYLKVNDFKNFLCCKTCAAKVLKYSTSEVTKSNQNKFTQGALDSLNSSCPRNMEQFGNGGKKCAHSFEVPITFLELFQSKF